MKRRTKKQQSKKVRDGKRKKSHYEKKRRHLHDAGLWGFEVAEPKPWK